MAGLLDTIEGLPQSLAGILGIGAPPAPASPVGVLPAASPAVAATPNPNMAPDPNGPAAIASAMPPAAPAYTPPPIMPQRGLLGDVLDKILLGGAINAHAQQEYARQAAIYRGQQMSQAYQNMTPQQQNMFMMDPGGTAAALEDNLKAQKMAPKETLVQGGNTANAYTAPDSGVTASGVAYGITPTDVTNLGYLPTYHNAPVSDQQGFAAPPPGTALAVTPGAPVAGVAGAPRAAVATAPAAPSAPSAFAGASTPQAVANGIFTVAKQNGLSDADGRNLVAIGKLESGLNVKPPSNGSSTGLFQFHPSTFANSGGTNINDPADQTQAAINLYKANQAGLTFAGVPVNPTTLYLAHQQGLPAATALLKADPQANAAQTLLNAGIYKDLPTATRAIAGNFGTPTMTNGQFLNMWQGKVGRRLQSVGGLTEANAAAAIPAQGGGPQAGPADPSAMNAPAPISPSAAGALGAPLPNSGFLQPSAGKGYSAPAPIAGSEGLYQTAPDGKGGKMADPAFGMSQVLAMRKDFNDSDEYKNARTGINAVNSLNTAIQNAAGNNGVIDMAAIMNLSRSETGGVPRQGQVKTILDHFGLPQDIENRIASATGNGALTPESLQQVMAMLNAYAQTSSGIAQQRLANDEAFANKNGHTLALQIPAITPTPKVSWLNPGDPAPAPGAAPAFSAAAVQAEIARRRAAGLMK